MEAQITEKSRDCGLPQFKFFNHSQGVTMPEWLSALVNILGGTAVGGVVWLFREVQKLQTALALQRQKIKAMSDDLAKFPDLDRRITKVESDVKAVLPVVQRVEEIVRRIEFSLVGKTPYDPNNN